MTCDMTRAVTTHVACTDGFRRARSASATGQIVLVAPPAETALLTPSQARQLSERRDALACEVDGGADSRFKTDTAGV
jgi:hypothetical protein